MPVLILDAAELVALLAVAIAIGLLYTLQVWLTPLLTALHSALGWVPGVGSLISKVQNAVTGALNDAISGAETILADLFNGLVYSFEEMVKGVKALANEAQAALSYMYDHAIIDKVKPLLANVTDLLGTLPHTYKTFAGWINAVDNAAAAGLKDVRSWVNSLVGDVPNPFASVVAWVTHEVAVTLSKAETYTDHAVSDATSTLEQRIAAAENAAETYASQAISELGRSVQQSIGAAEQAARAGVAEAESLASTAENVLAGNIGDVNEALRNLINELDLPDLLKLLTTVPALAALVNLVLTETGLGNESCRAKVKGICGTDPAGWANLVAGLVPLGVGLALGDLIGLCQDATGAALDGVTGLVGVNVG